MTRTNQEAYRLANFHPTRIASIDTDPPSTP
jgi:hypothetical protein